MKLNVIILILLLSHTGVGQSLQKIPDSIRNKKINQNPKSSEIEKKVLSNDSLVNISPDDELIKQKLIKLALKNPSFIVADANIAIAELNRKKANTAWLSQISAGANINEFVIQGSAAASFFPKYNLGVSIPFDIIQKTKLAKTTADQTIIINEAMKTQQSIAIKAEVLTRYENYKEKKQLVELQKISMENDLSAYENAQIDYAEGTLKISEMNKVYQSYVNEKSKLVSREREVNVAIIQLEEIIGVPLKSIF